MQGDILFLKHLTAITYWLSLRNISIVNLPQLISERRPLVTLSFAQSSEYSLRESFASLMKHSVHAQRRYYDKMPLAQKQSKALDFLGLLAPGSLDENPIVMSVMRITRVTSHTYPGKENLCR